MTGNQQGWAGKLGLKPGPRLGLRLWIGWGALALVGCARLHHVQVSDIDSSQGALQPFEVKMNSTGISTEEGAEVAKALTTSRESRRRIDAAESIVALTQMGPKTGDPTLSDDWADQAAQRILARCPTGRVTGLSARRETMDYPVITGEAMLRSPRPVPRERWWAFKPDTAPITAFSCTRIA